MPQSRPAVDFETVDRLKAEGLSYRKIADRLKTNFQAVYRAHHRVVPSVPSVPGTPTALERTIVTGEPVSTPPEYPSAPVHDVLVQRVDAQDQRLDVLEAFMRAMEQHPMVRQGVSAPSTPEYTAPREWKKSGAEFAVDMPDRLRAYAKAHGRQVREVIDQALRAFLTAHEAPPPVQSPGGKA
jgi:hypothetical protein